MAATVWLAERPLPRAYRRAGFHAISESTRDDLVARGVPPRADPGHPSRRRLRRGSARARRSAATAEPHLPVRWTAEALQRSRRSRSGRWPRPGARGPTCGSTSPGAGDHRAGARAAGRASSGSREAVPVPRLRERGREAAAASGRPGPTSFRRPRKGGASRSMEAAACGTPSIASDSPGLRDSVRHGETGYLVPHGDVEALAARMLELAGDPALVARLGAGGPPASPNGSPGSAAADRDRGAICRTSSPARTRA